MSSEILRVVGQVAGIGGIALGVFLLLFRDVIRKAIFPTLTKEQGYRLLRLIVVLVWVVSIFGIMAWMYVERMPGPNLDPGRLDVTDVFGDRKAWMYAERMRDPNLHLGRLDVTDVFVDDHREDFTAIVDFRLANRGNRPLSVSRVRFDVVDVEEILTVGALDFSAKYDLDISSLRRVGDHAEVVVSQALQPGEVDRFAVVLTAKEMGMGVIRIWRLQPTLKTSEGEVPVEPIVVGLPKNITKPSSYPGL